MNATNENDLLLRNHPGLRLNSSLSSKWLCTTTHLNLLMYGTPSPHAFSASFGSVKRRRGRAWINGRHRSIARGKLFTSKAGQTGFFRITEVRIIPTALCKIREKITSMKSRNVFSIFQKKNFFCSLNKTEQFTFAIAHSCRSR